MPAPVRVSIQAARGFQLQTLGLEMPFAGVEAALDHLGYVQMDPINVCGRMHDLILRNRVPGYREDDLLRYLYPAADRPALAAFENYLPGKGIIVTLPWSAWRYLRPHLDERAHQGRGYAGIFSKSDEKIARSVLEELRVRGPLTSDDIEHDGRTVSPWGSPGRVVKQVLAGLHLQGRVMIANRRGFRRVYDLPERVLPEAVKRERPASAGESARWLVLTQLRQRRLVALKRHELPLVEDVVQPVRVDDGSVLHCLREDVHRLEEQSPDATSPGLPVRLLAPLDPLIYDRAVTRRIWSFDYTWEVYTPPAKRVRGYYALPVLVGREIVGHVDPRADRKAGRLEVCGRRIRRGHRVTAAVKELAGFLGLRR